MTAGRVALPVALGMAMSTLPLVVLPTGTGACGCVLGGALVVVAALRRVPLADLAAALIAVSGVAVAVLSSRPYAPGGALVVGLLAYAYLAVGDLITDGGPPGRAALLDVGRNALGGGLLASVLLLIAGAAPVAGRLTVVGLTALVAAAVVALDSG
jgi:hypothetical protein